MPWALQQCRAPTLLTSAAYELHCAAALRIWLQRACSPAWAQVVRNLDFTLTATKSFTRDQRRGCARQVLAWVQVFEDLDFTLIKMNPFKPDQRGGSNPTPSGPLSAGLGAGV